MKSYKFISSMKNLPQVDLFPIFWSDGGGDIDEDNAIKFREKLQNSVVMVNVLTIAAMVLGSLVIIIGLVLPCIVKK